MLHLQQILGVKLLLVLILTHEINLNPPEKVCYTFFSNLFLKCLQCLCDEILVINKLSMAISGS